MSKLVSSIAFVFLAAFAVTTHAQQARPKATVGAYYFDGWSGKTDDIHMTKLLATEFADRKPVWGWKDDTVEIMQEQIDYCADHDIAFGLVSGPHTEIGRGFHESGRPVVGQAC
ncbi:MAG: hypothetical protein ABSG53_16345 [Thermoguttaceae bacterium]